MQANHVEITGNLASRPEVRNLPSGTPVANARIGQSYSYDTKDGAKRHTNWFTLAFYGELARGAVRLKQGDELNVVGTIQQREFTPKDGSTRKVYEIVVKEYRLVGRPAISRTTDPVRVEEPSANPGAKLLTPIRDETDAWAIL